MERRKLELSEDELQTFQSITSISDEESFEIFTRQKGIEVVGA